ncbi:hypothetical protein BKA64DRAFT_777501 [Cadophora sp. MPI-SDFR-AT-0126]|nr:hypothetical protein BKA64DRAFT_777501 [Leotiomycetes sp. MPI-SDFR-AT-0126]
MTDLLAFMKPLSQEIDARRSYLRDAASLLRWNRTDENQALWTKAYNLTRKDQAPKVTWASRRRSEAIAISLRNVCFITRNMDRDDRTLEDIVKAISGLPHLKIIYVVVDFEGGTFMAALESAHFVKFVCRTEPVHHKDGKECDTRKTLNVTDAARFGIASTKRRTIQKIWEEHIASPCLELQIVSWPRDKQLSALASTFFQSELRVSQDTNWFRSIVQQSQENVLGGKNIVFVKDPIELFGPALAQKKMKDRGRWEYPVNGPPPLPQGRRSRKTMYQT